MSIPFRIPTITGLIAGAIKPLVGLASLSLSPFTMAFGLFTGAAYMATRRIVRHERVAAVTITVASMSLWISLFMSTRLLRWPGPGDLDDPVATAGFPLTAFEYPYPPMGGDVPPLAQWLPFFLNYLFWIMISILVVPRASRALRRAAVPIGGMLVVIGVLVTLYGLGDTLIRFD